MNDKSKLMALNYKLSEKKRKTEENLFFFFQGTEFYFILFLNFT